MVIAFHYIDTARGDQACPVRLIAHNGFRFDFTLLFNQTRREKVEFDVLLIWFKTRHNAWPGFMIGPSPGAGQVLYGTPGLVIYGTPGFAPGAE